jgi:amphi-Trp domain-containing protein
MSSDESFNYESIQDVETIRDFIQSLLQGFESGKISLSSNGDRIDLHPSDMLKFSVKAKKKSSTGKISIKVSWKEKSDSGSSPYESIKVTP